MGRVGNAGLGELSGEEAGEGDGKGCSQDREPPSQKPQELRDQGTFGKWRSSGQTPGLPTQGTG